MTDTEQFCSRCLAGLDSSEHHEKCATVETGEREPSLPTTERNEQLRDGPLDRLAEIAEAARLDWFSTSPTPALRAFHESAQPAIVLDLLRALATQDAALITTALDAGQTDGDGA